MPAPPLVTPEQVQGFGTGSTDPPSTPELWAVLEVVSALVRSYVGSTITPPTTATVTLQGTRSTRLDVGERPLTGVSSVVLDGTALDPSEYRWTRTGYLWRDAGWADPSRQVTVTLSYGYDKVPDDLCAVAISAAVRVGGNPSALTRVAVEGYEELASAPGAWTVGELLVLDRYRRRCWP